jgi:hypothetical protein
LLFIVGNRLRQVRFDSEKLSCEQWAKIAELSGLPEKAKAELEDYIGFYRAMRTDARQQYPNVVTKIEDARKWEAAALRQLSNLISSKDFFPAIVVGIQHQVPIFDEERDLIRDWLKQACEQKKKLLDWYDKALKRLHRSIRVRSSLFNLIRLLNGLQDKYTHQRISSSRSDPAFKYVLEVCRIAEPQLRTKRNEGEDTIHEITKRVVTEIIEGGGVFDIEGWGHLIPNWVQKNKISVDDHAGTVEGEFDKEGGHYITVNIPKPIEGEGSLFILTPWFAPEGQG